MGFDEKSERKMFAKKFAEHLKKMRYAQNMSAAQLGKAINMERSHIARLEKEDSVPSLFLIKKISDSFNLSISEFLKEFE